MKIDKIIYYENEEVEYLSQVDHTWKKGQISRFTQEGFDTVAIIWEDKFANRVFLNNENIRKI